MAECEKVCKYIDLPLQHASADVLRRMRRPGNRDGLRQAARAHPRPRARTSRCARRSSSASRARPKQDFEELCAVRPRDRVRSRRRVHLLARGRHARVTSWTTTCRPRIKAARRTPSDAAAARRSSPSAPADPDRRDRPGHGRRPVARIAAGRARAGSKARRRTSTPMVVPRRSAIRRRSRPGMSSTRAITGAAGYDLVAAPPLTRRHRCRAVQYCYTFGWS